MYLFYRSQDGVFYNPPSQLTENYYKCRSYPDAAFYNSLGVSTGIVSLVMGCMAILLLPMVACLIPYYVRIFIVYEYISLVDFYFKFRLIRLPIPEKSQSW